MNNVQAVLISLMLFAVLLSYQPAGNPQAPSAPAGPGAAEAVQPPAPPLYEDFDGAPQLSLFPRVGDYRPENQDQAGLSYWRTFRDHLLKISGVTRSATASGDRAFAFRIIQGIDSVSFFSPLAVTPNSSYRVNFKIKAELPAGGSAGIGIIEYDQFLWQAEQYPLSLDAKHRTGVQDGVRLTENSDWSEQTFRFTTGSRTRMIHLVLFREGETNRKPVMFDDLSIEPLN